MNLIIIRHLITEWNAKGIMQGSNDVSIAAPDAETLASIERNQTYLKKHLPFSQIYVSKMQRTAQTAALYGYKNCQKAPLLNELHFGQFEGQPKSLMLEALGTTWKKDPAAITLGEPLTALGERVKAFIQSIVHHDTVLAFGHGSWIRALVSIAKQGDIGVMNQFNLLNNQLVHVEVTEDKIELIHCDPYE